MALCSARIPKLPLRKHALPGTGNTLFTSARLSAPPTPAARYYTKAQAVSKRRSGTLSLPNQKVLSATILPPPEATSLANSIQNSSAIAFSDGSFKDGRIGSAAVLRESNGLTRMLRHGFTIDPKSAKVDPVVIAEAVGFILALNLLYNTSSWTHGILATDNRVLIDMLVNSGCKYNNEILSEAMAVLSSARQHFPLRSLEMLWVPSRGPEANKEAHQQAENARLSISDAGHMSIPSHFAKLLKWPFPVRR